MEQLYQAVFQKAKDEFGVQYSCIISCETLGED